MLALRHWSRGFSCICAVGACCEVVHARRSSQAECPPAPNHGANRGVPDVGMGLSRQAEMEKELVEKKLARLEGARGAEIADLQAELESLRGSAREQLKEKEGRLNSLVEELSKTQSLLSEKETELEGVCTPLPCASLNSHAPTPLLQTSSMRLSLRMAPELSKSRWTVLLTDI